MSKLLVLRGVPASGKSTFAQQYVADRTRWVRVNRDDIRLSMFGKYIGVDENVVTDAENMMVESALREGWSVVLDATNLNRKFLRSKFSLASRYGATVEFEDFPISMEDAKFRDMNRERRVGARAIEDFFRRYKINPQTGILPPAPEPMPVFERYVRNTERPAAFIIDTDGTVANSDGVRSPYDTSKYHLDEPNEHVCSVVRGLAEAGNAVIGLSGRDEAFWDVTVAWWHQTAGLEFDEFFMRPAGDKRMDAIVKYELFKERIEPNYNVLGAFDDRPQVIRMWRSIGVPVFDVGEGIEF